MVGGIRSWNWSQILHCNIINGVLRYSDHFRSSCSSCRGIWSASLLMLTTFIDSPTPHVLSMKFVQLCNYILPLFFFCVVVTQVTCFPVLNPIRWNGRLVVIRLELHVLCWENWMEHGGGYGGIVIKVWRSGGWNKTKRGVGVCREGHVCCCSIVQGLEGEVLSYNIRSVVVVVVVAAGGGGTKPI